MDGENKGEIPSIMGRENPKLRGNSASSSNGEREVGSMEGDTDQMETASNPGQQAPATARPSKESISREERMKVVREKQLEDHRRRLDELRQAQMQALRAKQQLDLDRRRRLEEQRLREEQRRAAVDARRKKIEDEEKARREAILRKHQEIFDRIDEKRRQHQSRRLVYGTSANLNRMSDSTYSPMSASGHASSARRAQSVGVLTARPRRSHSRRDELSQRSSHDILSPGSGVMSQSARQWSQHLSTPSRPGEQSVSGSTAGLSPSGWKGSRQGVHWRATARSQPPPSSRSRAIHTARARLHPEPAQSQQGDAQVLHLHTDGASQTKNKAQRPNSLMTRSVTDTPLTAPDNKTTPRPSDTFRVSTKRSQSVGSASGRRKPKENDRSEVQVLLDSPATPQESPFNQSGESESEDRRPNRRVKVMLTSEAEAKAALAEKRRQAREKMQMEAEGGQPGESETLTIVTDAPVAELVDIESSEDALTSKKQRSESITAFEADEARMLMLAGMEPDHPVADLPVVTSETIVTSVQAQVDVSETAAQLLDDLIQVQVQANSQQPETRPVSPPAPSRSSPSLLTEGEVDAQEKSVEVDAHEAIRLENERRHQEVGQREEEERQARRQRLEAIRKMTKAATPQSPAEPDKKTLVSPVQEDSTTAALENARRLLQRRLNGTAAANEDVASPLSSDTEGGINGKGEEWSSSSTIGESWRPAPLVDVDGPVGSISS